MAAPVEWWSPACGRLATAGLLAATLIAPGAARAGVDWTPYAVAQYERGHNDVEDPADLEPPQTGKAPSSYTQDLVRLAGGLRADYRSSLQRVQLDARGGTVSYDKLEDIGSDSEYRLSALAELVFGDDWSATAQALTEDRVTSLNEDLVGAGIDAQRRLDGALRWQPLRKLALEVGGGAHDLDTPVRQDPDFGLREDVAFGSARLLATDTMSVGVGYEEIEGDFRGSIVGTGADYRQETPYALFQSYGLEGGPTLDVRLGRSERRQEGIAETFEETTGAATLGWPITGKTTVNLRYSRNFENYFGVDAGGFGLVSRANAGIEWQLTGKTRLYADVGTARTEFLGQFTLGLAQPGRRDRYSSAAVKLSWIALPWLRVRLLGRLDTQESNLRDEGLNFDGQVLRLSLEARLWEDWSGKETEEDY